MISFFCYLILYLSWHEVFSVDANTFAYMTIFTTIKISSDDSINNDCNDLFLNVCLLMTSMCDIFVDYLNNMVFRFSDFNSVAFIGCCSNVFWFIFITDRILISAVAYAIAVLSRFISSDIIIFYHIYFSLYLIILNLFFLFG